MTTMKPCPRCHSTEHLHIEIVDDYMDGVLSAKAGCTECNVYAQRDYMPAASGVPCHPSDVQVVREVIRQWNEQCDDWEGMFDHER